MTSTPGKILGYLHEQRSAMVELLARLARAESPSNDPVAVAKVLDILAEELQRTGMSVRRFRGRVSAGALLARSITDRGRRSPMQLLLGHCDTVWPVGSLEKMPVRIEDGIIRGPGVFDMKGGLVQMIYALRAVQALRLETPARSVVVINSDEEIGSPDSTLLIRRLAARATRAFVLEPAFGPSGALKTARKGVGGFTVTITGKAAHAGLDPHQGVSAILELSHQIQRLFALNDPARGITVNVGTINGGLRANVVAAEAHATVDIRVPTLADGDAITAAVRGLGPMDPRTSLRVEGGFEHPPLEPSPRNRALWRLARDLGRLLGLDLQEAAVGGASDGNTTSLYTATLDGLGAVGDGAHALHEQVEIARLVERSALLALLLNAPVEPEGHLVENVEN